MDPDRLRQVFGKELRKARKNKGFSQEQLALTVDLDRTFISMLERGIRQPSIHTLFLLAGPLDITPDTLVKRTRQALEGG